MELLFSTSSWTQAT